MLEEPKTSPLVYVFGAVVAALVLGGVYWLRRGPPPSGPSDPAALQRAEEYFKRWGGYLIWDQDMTEFALPSDAARPRKEFFEVRRKNGNFTIRQIPELTRPLIDHGDQVHCPMQFTETAEMRAAFYRDNPHYVPAAPVPGVLFPELPPLPPQRFGGQGDSGPVAAPPPNLQPTPDEVALLARLGQAVAAAGEPSISPQLGDLIAALYLNRISPQASIAQRKERMEKILAGSSAFLTAKQLELYRVELNRDIFKR